MAKIYITSIVPFLTFSIIMSRQNTKLVRWCLRIMSAWVYNPMLLLHCPLPDNTQVSQTKSTQLNEQDILINSAFHQGNHYTTWAGFMAWTCAIGNTTPDLLQLGLQTHIHHLTVSTRPARQSTRNEMIISLTQHQDPQQHQHCCCNCHLIA